MSYRKTIRWSLSHSDDRGGAVHILNCYRFCVQWQTYRTSCRVGTMSKGEGTGLSGDGGRGLG